MAKLLYGTGLRLMECVRLRVKDVDFEQNQVTVREGKGFKDRVTMLPGSLKGPWAEHLRRVKLLHEQDLAAGQGRVYLPYALSQKYPAADLEWGYWPLPLGAPWPAGGGPVPLTWQVTALSNSLVRADRGDEG